jgi:hypothetical protein
LGEASAKALAAEVLTELMAGFPGRILRGLAQSLQSQSLRYDRFMRPCRESQRARDPLANTGMSGGYRRIAKNQARQGRWWSAVAVLSLIVAAVVAAVFARHASQSSSTGRYSGRERDHSPSPAFAMPTQSDGIGDARAGVIDADGGGGGSA